MAALLVGLSVLAVLMTMALPVWTHYAKREKEEELIWRGQQYARAIGLFQRKYANTFPPNLQVLLDQKFLRKKYKDPITNDDFMLIPVGSAVPGRGSGPGNSSPAQPGLGPGQQPGLGPGQQPGLGPVQQPGLGPGQKPAPGVPGGFGGGTEGSPTSIGTFQPVQGTGPNTAGIGIQGVVSKSPESSIKMYNGRTKYNEWAFIYMATSQRVGGRGVQQPGMGGGPGSRFPGMGPPGSRPPGSSPFGPGGPGGPGPGGPPTPFSPPGQPQPPGTSPFAPAGSQPTRPPPPPPDR
jgi:type II secretory pathway pseudopilin PulG